MIAVPQVVTPERFEVEKFSLLGYVWGPRIEQRNKHRRGVCDTHPETA